MTNPKLPRKRQLFICTVLLSAAFFIASLLETGSQWQTFLILTGPWSVMCGYATCKFLLTPAPLFPMGFFKDRKTTIEILAITFSATGVVYALSIFTNHLDLWSVSTIATTALIAFVFGTSISMRNHR